MGCESCVCREISISDDEEKINELPLKPRSIDFRIKYRLVYFE
jgi:hypothetical protein